MMTSFESLRSCVASLTSIACTSPVGAAPACGDPLVLPKPPRITLTNERFMALHMM